MLVLLAAIVLAGCLGPAVRPPSGVAGPCAGVDPKPLADDAEFVGDNAWTHVAHLVCDLTTDPPTEQVRVPGTPGREAAAIYAAGELGRAGWRVSFQNFTGSEYESLEKGNVSAWAGPQCDPADRNRVRALTFSNVVGEIGTGPPSLLLMAHYDAKRYANQDRNATNRTLPVPGANDGASGVGVLLELARVVAREGLNRSLRVLLVDGEDGFDDCHPDAGSLYYARHLTESQRRGLPGVILLDMVGDAEARFCFSGNAPALRESVRNASRALHVTAVSQAGNCTVTDDHTPFMDLGIPAVDLIDYARPDGFGFPPYWHTRQDTPDKVSPAMLEAVGRVIVVVVRAGAS